MFACDVCNLEQNKSYGVQGSIQMRNKTVWSVKMNSLNAGLPLAGRVKNINKEGETETECY